MDMSNNSSSEQHSISPRLLCTNIDKYEMDKSDVCIFVKIIYYFL